MKVIVEAESSPDIWHYPQTSGIVNRIYANQPFQTWHGQIIPAGSPFNPATSRHFLPNPCTINGGIQFTQPAFEIDSTEDSPTDPNAVYSSYIFAGNTRLFPRLLGFPIRAVHDINDPGLTLNLTWTELEINRDARRVAVMRSSGMFEAGTVDYKIAQALAFLRMGSTTQVGMLALQDNPTDPNFPIALGPNSPQAAKVGAGGDVLVAGQATTVFTGAVQANSKIYPVAIDDTITGNLKRANVVPNTSFDVYSDNETDFGEFGWVLF